MKAVYVTRDSHDDCVEVWPATVGIRKFHGCVAYGAAWYKNRATGFLTPATSWNRYVKELNESGCRKRFGFYPKAGTAWYVNTRGKRTKVDIDFSD